MISSRKQKVVNPNIESYFSPFIFKSNDVAGYRWL